MKLMSVRYSSGALDLALLLLRVGMGVLMMPHGYNKLTHFNEYKDGFINFLGLGGPISLGLTVFGEFFCSILLVLGFVTRLAVIPMIIVMCTALFVAHDGEIFGEGEHAGLFLICFITLFMTGPGRYSIDGLVKR